MKRKQGRVTERSRTVREEKRGKKKILFTGRSVLLDLPANGCLLMGDPFFDVDSIDFAAGVYGPG